VHSSARGLVGRKRGPLFNAPQALTKGLIEEVEWLRMIDYAKYLLGKSVQVFTKDNVLEGVFEGMQILGPFNEGRLFVVIKMDEERIMFIPERLVERIYLVDEQVVLGEDDQGSSAGN
jgi:hypothetical protein